MKQWDPAGLTIMYLPEAQIFDMQDSPCSPTRKLPDRRRARCEDRIAAPRDTGPRNLPLHGYAQNQIWCEIVALACELLAWMAMLALPGPARRWEPM